jgi:hypothetical protein
MHPEFLTTGSRRTLLDRLGALLAIRPDNEEAEHSTEESQTVGADALLIRACAAFVDIERKKLLLMDGPDRIIDDDERAILLEPLSDEQLRQLDIICQRRTSSPAGHQARAGCFALWDGGELGYRARVNGHLEDQLLAALIRDLARVEW